MWNVGGIIHKLTKYEISRMSFCHFTIITNIPYFGLSVGYLKWTFHTLFIHELHKYVTKAKGRTNASNSILICRGK